MEARYNVYFAGQLLPGQDMASVRDKMATLFNADQQTLDKLFSGKTQLLKRDCDKATALKYKQAMERAGAQPIIKASETAATQPAPAPAPEKAMSAAERIAALAAAPDKTTYSSQPPDPVQDQSTDGDADMNLAPPGADVLREDERPQPATSNIDTSGLAVDAAAERLSEEAPPPPPAPDTSHLDMGEAGELIPNLPSDQLPLSPNTDALDLSPEGTDFSDCNAPDAEAPALDLAGIELAPAGTEVLEEKYRKKEEAAAPATDHISLEN
jgi:hypothetical protein